ncbi:peptide methionine sulfoxide reductase-like [Tubulanus polymorphus]|uniref:peptide methionine sulfoxide reductase-like n=1 Tax=Tubulanus polymorphus TaxID=672921 RepID=UPI003DA20CF8
MSAIFYHSDEQRLAAEKTKLEHEEKIKRKTVTKILPAETFYDAEDYHQKYLLQVYNGSLLVSLNIDEDELITSHVAARLNGYAARYAPLELFEKEWKQLGLNDDQVNYVRNQIKKGLRS